jgi:hypothetical protein
MKYSEYGWPRNYIKILKNLKLAARLPPPPAWRRLSITPGILKY